MQLTSLLGLMNIVAMGIGPLLTCYQPKMLRKETIKVSQGVTHLLF